MEIFKKLSEIDFKTLSIILLLIASLILGFGWLHTDTSSKKLIDKIEKDNKEIQIEKEKLLKDIKDLDTNIEKVEKDIQKKDDKIKKLEISLFLGHYL
jgi:peptidoglycan hydrolase CwlO-like protein